MTGAQAPSDGHPHAEAPGPAGRPRGLRRLAFAAVLAGGALLLGLLLAETAVRLFIPVTDVVRSFWDPVIGARPLPNQRGRYVRSGRIDAAFHFNAQGWNHPRDYATSKPPGTTRVCVIGDSYVEALHVDPDQSLTLVGERTMSRPGRPAEWFAFGISSCGLAQYYLILRHYVTYYRPDAVVVVLVPNDVYDSSPYLVSSESAFSTFDVGDDGIVRLFTARPFEPSWRSRLLYKSALARFLFVQRQIHRPAGGMRELRKGVFMRDESGGKVLLGPGLTFDQRAERSWQHAENVLRLMRDECRGMSAPLLLAFVGNDYLLRAVYEGRAYEPAPRDKDPYCMNERIWDMGPDWWQPIAERLGIPYLDLTAPLSDAVRKTGQRHDFGEVGDDHYCGLGHRVAGEAIAARLGRLIAERP